MESKYVYEKTRADFGKQCIFDTFGPNVDEEILPDPGKMDDFIVMESRDAATQLSKQMALHEVQSSAFATRNSGMFHFEGGWPKDIYPLDEEVTARYRRRVEKSEIWAPKLRPLFQMTERFVLQNNAVNIYQHYFDDMIPTPLIKPQELRIVNVYTDTQPPARPVSGISWAPYMLRQLAVSYCFPIDQTIPGASKKAHIWDFDNPNSPTISLEALYPIVVTEFNPRHPSVLISGLTSGQVCCWDIRHGYSPVQVSPASVSHKNPSRVIVKWLCARSSAEFLSGATSDGRAMWWDARKLNKPIETVIFDMKESFDIESEKEEAGVLSLNFESKLNMLMFGMENGVVFGYSSESQTPTEKLTKRFNAHLGPVIAVDRNTYSPEVFLTLSNVKVKIWSDDVREVELLSSEPFNDALTGGCWSKHRYSVFYTINTRGDLCAWDLLQNTELPILKEHISSQILTAIAPQMNGNLLAIGDNGGSLYFVEPSNFFLNFTYKDETTFSKSLDIWILSAKDKEELILEEEEWESDSYGEEEIEDMEARKHEEAVTAAAQEKLKEKLAAREMKDKQANKKGKKEPKSAKGKDKKKAKIDEFIEQDGKKYAFVMELPIDPEQLSPGKEGDKKKPKGKKNKGPPTKSIYELVPETQPDPQTSDTETKFSLKVGVRRKVQKVHSLEEYIRSVKERLKEVEEEPETKDTGGGRAVMKVCKEPCEAEICCWDMEQNWGEKMLQKEKKEAVKLWEEKAQLQSKLEKMSIQIAEREQEEMEEEEDDEDDAEREKYEEELNLLEDKKGKGKKMVKEEPKKVGVKKEVDKGKQDESLKSGMKEDRKKGDKPKKEEKKKVTGRMSLKQADEEAKLDEQGREKRLSSVQEEPLPVYTPAQKTLILKEMLAPPLVLTKQVQQAKEELRNATKHTGATSPVVIQTIRQQKASMQSEVDRKSAGTEYRAKSLSKGKIERKVLSKRTKRESHPPCTPTFKPPLVKDQVKNLFGIPPPKLEKQRENPEDDYKAILGGSTRRGTYPGVFEFQSTGDKK